MLKQKLQELFARYHGVVHCTTLRRSNDITFTVTEDGQGFTCSKGPAVFSFDSMDALEHEMKIVAKYNHGKIYYGANMARNGLKLGEDMWFENTIDGILARRCFNRNDGDSVYAASTFIAALLEKVGFAYMHSKDSTDAYVVLTGRF